MSEKMRAEFELWLNDNGQLALKEESGEYSFQHTRCAWEAWQASRAALVVELPSLENGLIHPFDGPSMIVDAVAKQLDAAGVNYK